MNAQAEISDTSFDMLVDIESEEIATGGNLLLRCAVRATPARDLRGKSVQIFDHEGALVGCLPFTMLDGATNTTDPASFAVPVALGSHTWRAVISAVPKSAAPQGEAAQEFFFKVVPHRSSLLVWGAPSAIALGQSFDVTIGLKCSGGCNMAGREIHIYDATGSRVASSVMSADTHQGSSGLHETKVTLPAPADVSRQVWQARIARDDDAPTHEGAEASFCLNFVHPPEHRVTITVLDASTKAPLGGANITAHPFWAKASAEGVATFLVSSGSYKVWVSAPGHDPVCKHIEVTGDHQSVAELSPEIKEDPDAMYY